MLAVEGHITLPNGAQLSSSDIERLLSGEWLNDELINYCMWRWQHGACMQGMAGPSLLRQWNGSPGASCHFFNSFFMAKLYLDAPRGSQCGPGQISYAAVRLWTTCSALKKAGQSKFDVLDCSLLVAPCNLDQGAGGGRPAAPAHTLLRLLRGEWM